MFFKSSYITHNSCCGSERCELTGCFVSVCSFPFYYLHLFQKKKKTSLRLSVLLMTLAQQQSNKYFNLFLICFPERGLMLQLPHISPCVLPNVVYHVSGTQKWLNIIAVKLHHYLDSYAMYFPKTFRWKLLFNTGTSGIFPLLKCS